MFFDVIDGCAASPVDVLVRPGTVTIPRYDERNEQVQLRELFANVLLITMFPKRLSVYAVVAAVAVLVVGCSSRGGMTGSVVGPVRGRWPGVNRQVQGAATATRSSEQHRHTTTTATRPFPLTLPAGTYRFTSSSGQIDCAAPGPVVVVIGKTTQVEVVQHLVAHQPQDASLAMSSHNRHRLHTGSPSSRACLPEQGPPSACCGVGRGFCREVAPEGSMGSCLSVSIDCSCQS